MAATAFLQNFDMLIDYRHQNLRIELPLQLTGNCHGKLTHNRLVNSSRMLEFGNATMSLLLDSGANQLVFFNDLYEAGVAAYSHWKIREWYLTLLLRCD
jgi:hypothetical protein